MEQRIFSLSLSKNNWTWLRNVCEVNGEHTHIAPAFRVYNSTKHNGLVTLIFLLSSLVWKVDSNGEQGPSLFFPPLQDEGDQAVQICRSCQPCNGWGLHRHALKKDDIFYYDIAGPSMNTIGFLVFQNFFLQYIYRQSPVKHQPMNHKSRLLSCFN